MGEVLENELILQHTRGKVRARLQTRLVRQWQVDWYQTFLIISPVAATNQADHHYQKQAYSEQHDNGSSLTPHGGHL